LHMYDTQRAGEKSHRPVVFLGGLHPLDDWGFGRSMIYQAIKKVSYYIAYTGFEAQYVISRGAKPEKVAVVGLGVDSQPFLQISTGEAKRRYNLEGKTVIGFIGQIGGHKGVDTLVQAMPKVWELMPEVHVLIAGARTLFCDTIEKMIAQWPEEHKQKLILKYNFENDEKPWLFSAVDIFAYPSGFESYGIAFLEAWAAGKPVIGCRRGAVPWVVCAGQDGLLIEYQSSEMLAEAIIILLQNPGLAKAMGEAGRRKILAENSWPKVATRVRQIYQQAINLYPYFNVI
jgi:glycosyltransferase involved in cell wall biosynthesis